MLAALASCAALRDRTARAEFDEGLSLFNRGRYAEAAGHFEKATELAPEFGDAYLYLGRSYLNLGRWSEAVPPLRTAYRLSPDETRAQIADIILDVLLRNAGRLDRETESRMRDILPPE